MCVCIVESILLDKKQREFLREKNNARAWIDISLRILFLLVTGSFSFYFLDRGYYILGVFFLVPYCIGFTFLGTAGISHELFHLSVFNSKKTNRLFYVLFSFLTWNNYGFFDVTHWRHHKHTLTPEDPKDLFRATLKPIQIIQMMSFDAGGLYRRLRILLLNARNIVPSNRHTDQLFPPNSPNRKKLILSSCYILLFHGFSVIIFVLLKMPLFILFINLAAFLFTFPNKILAIAQHYGTDGPAHGDYFLSTRTVKLNRFLSFLYANMNYHVEHHLYPEIPYYNLHRVHNEILPKSRYAYLSTGFWELLKDLKAKGLFGN